MTTPKASNKSKQQKTTTTVLLTRFLACLLLTTLFVILGPTRSMLDQHHAAIIQQQNKLPGPSKNYYAGEVDVEELEHEQAFRDTITQCLPLENPKKCKQFVGDDNNNNNIKRVAIISPPGDLSSALTKRVQAMVHQEDTEIIVRTHVPPYGYGKTHGLTQVIRFVPQPLLLQVTDALQSLLKDGETHAIITLADVKAALRQILRFHCRISHLSAHTALLSADPMEDFEESLRKFLVVSEDQQLDDDTDALYQVHASRGTQTLTHIQAVSKVNDVLAILDQVLLEEMESSKSLTIWPCLSFWSAGDAPDPTQISPLVQRLAQALSPDCGDPHAKCWVERDKCEAAGMQSV